MLFQRIVPFGILSLMMGSVFSCAPNKARQIREMRPVTVGLPIGAMYRPTGDIALGAAYGRMIKDNYKVDTEQKRVNAEGKEEELEEFNAKINSSVFRPYVHYYPWADSAFFLGIGLDVRRSIYKVEENAESELGALGGEKDLEYDVSTQRVRIPVGWSWIWGNGISLLMDLGPRVAVQQSGSDSEEAETTSANTRRADTLSDLDSEEQGAIIEPVFLLGYSF